MIITRVLWKIHFNVLLKILFDSVTNFHYTLGLLRKENIIIGSLFVQTLVQQWYLKCNEGIHILELLTHVNSVICNKGRTREVPFIISSLRKRLFIGPIVDHVTDSGDIVPFGMLLNISEHQFTVWYAYLIVFKGNTIDSTVDTSLNESDLNNDDDDDGGEDWYVIAIGMSDDNYDDMIMNKEFLIAL